MPSWSSPLAESAASYEVLLRRFVESSRRAEIIAMVNLARTEAEVAEAVTEELSEAFDAEIAFVLVAREGGVPPVLAGTKGLAPPECQELLHHPRVIRALEGERAELHLGGLGGSVDAAPVLALAPFRTPSGDRGVLGVVRLYDDPLDEAELALLEAVAKSTGHGLERCWLAAEREHHAAQQAALARAAKSLNATLELDQVLDTLCTEVSLALGADIVLVYFGTEPEGLTVVAGHGGPEDFAGYRLGPEDGVATRALRLGAVQVTNAYLEEGHNPSSTAAFRHVRRAAAAPLRRRTTPDGVLSVGWSDLERWITPADEDLLAAFAELAGVACRNADDHAAARRAATLDSLTGCLNHAGFQERLRAEISRAERGCEPFALALLDLDDFKGVNERHGHLAGDSVLRTVGTVLRDFVRMHDHVARFGGDEFALLLPATDADVARGVVNRALEAMEGALSDDAGPLRASAGIAEWTPGSQATQVIGTADDALRASKRARRGDRRVTVHQPEAAGPTERRTRRLATAGAVGARLARLLDPQAIAETAVGELRRAFGYESCSLLRLDDQGQLVPVAVLPAVDGPGRAPRPQDDGAVGRALREQRPVLADRVTVNAEGARGGAELAVPLYSASTLWGAVELRSPDSGAFDGDDAQVVQTVADHVGAALRTAELYRALEETHLGTAEALAAALEAKDDYTADHARSIADVAVQVGEALALDEHALRDLRLGAIFHDIGKIAIPDAILNKRGPLTPEEFEVVKRHPVVGEQILAPVPFLRGVRRIVRHDHERWDGTGYPDGLRDSEIPLGARVVFVVDAYHAMTSDRPYRKGMRPSSALAELESHAGTQFDPGIVATFLRLMGGHAAPGHE
jgi:diguanylate cyclase (GGDEF)-like protein